jgi:putative nucleotidyltransferase with HDIG domain
LIPCAQSPDFHPEGSAYEHVRLMLDQLPPDASPSLPWAVLLHDIGKPPTTTRDALTGSTHFYGHEKAGAELAEAILLRLKFPRRQIEEIVACVRHHMQFKDVPHMRKATLRRLLMRPTFPLELELHRLDCAGSHHNLSIYHSLVTEAAQLEANPQLRPPLLHGQDLIEMGWAPGPALGQVLREIREKQLQDELTTTAEALAWARQRIASRRGPETKHSRTQ